MQRVLYNVVKLLVAVIISTSCSAETLTDGVYLGERCSFTLNYEAVYFQEMCSGDFRRMEKSGAHFVFGSKQDGSDDRGAVSKDAHSEGGLNYLSFVEDFSRECQLDDRCSQGILETKYLREFLKLDVGGDTWIFWPDSKIERRLISGDLNDPGLRILHGVETSNGFFVITSYMQILPEYASFSVIKFEKEKLNGN